jgi:hypothetical protein
MNENLYFVCSYICNAPLTVIFKHLFSVKDTEIYITWAGLFLFILRAVITLVFLAKVTPLIQKIQLCLRTEICPFCRLSDESRPHIGLTDLRFIQDFGYNRIYTNYNQIFHRISLASEGN